MAFLNGYNFHPTIRPVSSNMTRENVGYKLDRFISAFTSMDTHNKSFELSRANQCRT